MIKVKIKRINKEIETKIPAYSKEGDAGLDLVATSKEKGPGGIATYGTNLAVEIPLGFVGLLFPRSSICKYELSLANSVGVIDSGYRGEIMLKFRNTDWTDERNCTYDVGDKIGQLIIIPYPQVEFEEVGELSESFRGATGFGSSGK
jgi:dUTP pyrophosphatase